MADLLQVNQALRASFNGGVNKSYEQRVKNLKLIKSSIETNYDEACKALGSDLGRSHSEASVEMQAVVGEINDQLKNLKAWMQPEPRMTHMMLTPGHTEVRREPFGVVLVIGPFNYPMVLCLVPVIGALAAGNTVVLKPSEQTTACEAWFCNHLAKAVPPEVLRVVRADVPRTTELLKHKWDFIFFTGSPFVGKIVSRAAAEHLTPTVMELGGKAPVVVDESVASISECAKRVCWGKFINAGQTCMAPDYVLVHSSKREVLLKEMAKQVEAFYGADPKASEDYGRLCTAQHANRAIELIETSKGRVVCGGAKTADAKARYVPPTIIDSPARDSKLMTSEVFGPVLPVIAYEGGVESAIAAIREIDPQPLALYVFGANKANTEALLASIQSGDAMVNDTFLHYINASVPFGGVGNSGHGTYRGRLSFECFTYPRGIVWRHGVLDIDQAMPFNFRYPPSGKLRKSLLPHAVSLLPYVPRVRWGLVALAAAFAAGAFVNKDLLLSQLRSCTA
jgi:aldehyde dehydrogenase (NAD+)